MPLAGITGPGRYFMFVGKGSEMAIEVIGLSKTFNGNKRALRSVDLRIAHGEMVALIGASGSGKSTLLRHIGGLVAANRGPSGGTIKVLGATMQARGRISRDARRVRARVSVIFQQFNLVSRLTVLTNVLTGLLGQIRGPRGTFGLFTKSEKQAAIDALSRVAIPETALQRASTLSGGQQQRAAIARALVQGADIILADEPIASLDPASSKRVMETLREINEADGKTVVVSLHQVDYAMRYCPRTIALRDGMVVYDGASAALDSEMLQRLYGAECDELLESSGLIAGDEPATPPEPQKAYAVA
jgi:phosphonate transport system ATP-binding protein